MGSRVDIREDVELQPFNTLALAGRAAHFATLTDLDQAHAALAFARERGLPVTVLGAGSNLVLAGDLPGLVLQVAIRGCELVAERDDHLELRLGAGEDWPTTVEYCLAQGWYGLENLALIPGTVGAAPVQNIGAYGVELAQRFVALEALDIATGAGRRFERDECRFGYRTSLFKGDERDRWLITSVTLTLSRAPRLVLEYPALAEALTAQPATAHTPAAVAAAVCALRRARLPDPALLPNVGSFFENPVVAAGQAAALAARFPGLVTFPAPAGRVKLAAAWLIEQCGWKGVQRDGVAVHDRQALVLIHRGGGAVALLALAAEIRDSVRARFGVELVPEPRILGGCWR